MEELFAKERDQKAKHQKFESVLTEDQKAELEKLKQK